MATNQTSQIIYPRFVNNERLNGDESDLAKKYIILMRFVNNESLKGDESDLSKNINEVHR
jgi:hypothetical protein